ncbi:MAG: hypothetical protein KatS3mg104_0657 [Phycisphaerae bacterium]|nr:MAG: hypothetical protein KatS3mg104_0657 [Phycisphaerae bacterium]
MTNTANTILGLLAKTATPEEVFKSIGESLDASINPNHVILILVGLICLVVFLKYFTQTVGKKPSQKVINNPGKLTRELVRQLGLKKSELSQLRRLADQEGLEHPLSLLLCPSVLRSIVQKRQQK